MKKIIEKIEKNYKKLWFHALINAVILIFYCCLFYVRYETNDDMEFALILSGAYGSYQTHLVHINIIIGYISSWLYKNLGYITWHSVLQYLMSYASFVTISYAISNINKSKLLTLFSYVLTFIFSYDAYVLIQYTKTASYLAIAGICLMFYNHHYLKPKEINRIDIIASIFLLLSSMMRFKQFLFMCALSVPLVFVYLVATKKKEDIYTLLKSLLIPLILICCSIVADKIAYSSPEWKYYLEFNDVRTAIYDTSFPEWEDHMDTYSGLGINENAYKLYKGWNYDDPDYFDIEEMKVVLSVQDNRVIDLNTLKEIIQVYSDNSPMIIIALISALLLVLNGKDRCRIIYLALSVILLFSELLFAYYVRGEHLIRVELGIWMSFCYYILLNRIEFLNIKTKISVVLVISSFFVLANYLYNNRNELRFRKQQDMAERLSVQSFVNEINEDQEHLYITTCFLYRLGYDIYSPFEKVPFGIATNYAEFGGWEVNIPFVDDVLKKYGVTNSFRDMVNNDKVYLLENNVDRIVQYINDYHFNNVEAVEVGEVQGIKVYSIVSNN